jgi:hypothetical protein
MLNTTHKEVCDPAPGRPTGVVIFTTEAILAPE